MKTTLTILLLTAFLFQGCLSDKNSDNSDLLPGVTGEAFSLLLVIENSTWERRPGQTLKEVLSEESPGLPQSEPLFSISRCPKSAFIKAMRTHRSIITTRIASDIEKAEVVFRHNVWADQQAVISITAPSDTAFVAAVKTNADKIVSFLVNSEIKRIQNSYRKYEKIDITRKLREKYGIELAFPGGYKLDVSKDDFAWIAYETPKTSQSVLVYFYNYKDTADFALENLISKRDSFLKANVPGPLDSTYMVTDKDYEPYYTRFRRDGEIAVEIRSTWKLEGPDFMGGPFVSISTIDKSRNRIITVDGYVYAPWTEKRNLMRQVEAILYTLKIVPQ